MTGKLSNTFALAISVALFGTLPGCPTVQSSLSAKYDILYSQPTDASNPTGSILVVADNHAHHLFGDPTLFRSNWTDAEVSPSAIRPPQLDLFGQDFFRRIFEREQANEALIHLGDAMDLGCAAEWERFLSEMAAWPGPWVMAPGNHDAYFFGNFETASALPSWEAACATGGGPMRKNRFVAAYLAALAGEPENKGLSDAVHANAGAGRWHCAACASAFLQDVIWSIDQINPWRSYVVQRVNLGYCRKRVVPAGAPESCTKPLPAIHAILLDTATYQQATGIDVTALSHAAGKFGDVGTSQAAVVRAWLAEDLKSGVPSILMGHHDYNSLSDDGRGAVDAAIGAGSPFYVSAHTHQGGYFVHGGADTGWLELNLGSVLDWRPHYRRLQFFERGKRLAVRAWYRPVEASLDDCPIQNAWEPRPEELDFFERYTKMTGLHALDGGEARRQLADMSLAALDRMFLCVPLKGSGLAVTDQQCAATSKFHQQILAAENDPAVGKKLALARELIATAADKDGFEDPSRWARYRLCEALWASKYERDRARVPVIDDEYFLLPTSGKQ